MPLLGGELVEGELIVVSEERGPLAVERHGGQLGDRHLDRAGVLAGEGQVDALHHRELEDEVELVAVFVAEEVPLLLRRQVDLAEQDGVAPPALDKGPQLLEVAVGIGIARAAGRSVQLEQERHGVDSETGDPEPPARSPTMRAISSRTAGFVMLRSGWWA